MSDVPHLPSQPTASTDSTPAAALDELLAEWGPHLTRISHHERGYAVEAARVAVCEAAVGRQDIGDRWHVIAAGHELQADRYRDLAAAYS